MLIVKFISGEIVQGTAWNSLPTEKISALKYKIGNKIIYLSGYEEYNHLVEKVAQLGQAPKITKIFLVGRFNGVSKVFELDMTKKNITEYETPIGKEYEGGRPTTGWRAGDKTTPICSVVDSSLT